MGVWFLHHSQFVLFSQEPFPIIPLPCPIFPLPFPAIPTNTFFPFPKFIFFHFPKVFSTGTTRFHCLLGRNPVLLRGQSSQGCPLGSSLVPFNTTN